MGDVIRAYNEDAEVYNLSAGVDFLSAGGNLLKIAVPDVLHRANNSPYDGAFSKLASWDINAGSSFGATVLNEGGSNMGSSSLLIGANEEDLSIQSYIMRANNCARYTDPSPTSAHSLPSYGDRPSNMIQGLMPTLSPPPPPPSLHQPFFHSQDFAQSHAWGNAATELLLLPGSTEAALGRRLSPYPDLHSRPSIPIYGEISQPSSLPAWERLPMQNVGHGQALSLSLSSHHHTQSTLHSLERRISAPAGSLGVIRASKYFRPTQQLLDEFCSLGRSVKKSPTMPKSSPAEAGMKREGCRHKETYPAMAESQGASVMAEESGGSAACIGCTPTARPLHPDERIQLHLKKERLVALVEEVDKTYREYEEQVEMVMTSFESATGLGSAITYTALVRQAISRQFKLLRDAVSRQICSVCGDLGEEPSTVAALCKGETPRLRILDQQLRHQRALQQMGLLQQQPWRPQRGLPERSVSILRAWLFEHFLDPYPKDTEKLMLARQTGLTRSQVSNWFINARVRLWKPMIEDMYREEAMEGGKCRVGKRESCSAGGEELGRDGRAAAAAEQVSCSFSHREEDADQVSGPSDASASSPAYPSSGTTLIGEKLHSYGGVGGGMPGMHADSMGGDVRLSKAAYGYGGSTLLGRNHVVGSAGVTLTLGLQQSYLNAMHVRGDDGHRPRQHQSFGLAERNVLWEL